MNIEQLNGIVSTITLSPFVDTLECHRQRKMLFDKATVASNCSPSNHTHVFDESILVFESYDQALKFLVNLFRCAAKLNKRSECKISLRSSLCHGDYFKHQNQIYGDAINLAARLACSSRENELLVCCIDIRIVEDFINEQEDVFYFVRDQDENCISIGLLDSELTGSKVKPQIFKIEHKNKSTVFEKTRLITIKIGRSADADVFLDGDHISRNHAAITLKGNQVFIEDHSTNGTYLYFDGREIFLTNDSMKMSGNGYIYCGIARDANTKKADMISFELLEKSQSAA
jgi:adenylate cyclase